MINKLILCLLLGSPLAAQTASSNFDGDDYYGCTDLDIAGDITVAAWVCPTDAGASREDVVVKEDAAAAFSAQYNYRFFIRGDGAGAFTIRFEFRDAAAVAFGWLTSSAVVPVATDCAQPRQWSHIAMTYDEVSAPIFYYNGEAVASTQNIGSGVGTMGTSNRLTTIGGRQSVGSELFHGRIAHVALSQSIASAGVVNSLYVNPMRARAGSSAGVAVHHTWALWDAAPHNYGNNLSAGECTDPTGTTNDPGQSASGPPVRLSG